MTNLESFNRLRIWKDLFINKSSPEFADKVPILILGNKVDMEDEREVSKE